MVARPTSNVVGGNDCITTAALELYRWNNGEPTKIAGPANVEASSPIVIPTFVGDGVPRASRATTGCSSTAPTRAAGDSSNGDLYEGTGTISGSFTGEKIPAMSSDSELELQPTMSTDGRVLVFVKTTGGRARRPICTSRSAGRSRSHGVLPKRYRTVR